MFIAYILTCIFKDSTDTKFNFDSENQMLWLDVVNVIFVATFIYPEFPLGHKKRNLGLQLLDLIHPINTTRLYDVPSIHFTMNFQRKSRKSIG